MRRPDFIQGHTGLRQPLGTFLVLIVGIDQVAEFFAESGQYAATGDSYGPWFHAQFVGDVGCGATVRSQPRNVLLGPSSRKRSMLVATA